MERPTTTTSTTTDDETLPGGDRRAPGDEQREWPSFDEPATTPSGAPPTPPLRAPGGGAAAPAPAPPPPPPPAGAAASPAPPSSSPPARGRAPRALAVVGLVVALLAAGVVGGAIGARTADRDAASSSGPASARNSSVLTKTDDIQGVLAKVEPGVVLVRTQASRAGRFFPEGAGTGVILTPDGEVLTNAHVVDGATSITVTLNGETRARAADLVGADRSADVALLRIRDANDLLTVSLGRSAHLEVGDSVLAIGNALALEGGLTVTEGIVSALNRSLRDNGSSLEGLIQTDAAINRGNSGGPLVTADGLVVGINTAVAGGAENIGFALAIDRVKPVVERIRANPSGTTGAPSATGAFLGVSTSPGLTGGGVVVQEVVDGSPAERAGLRPGDVILSVGGAAITDPEELRHAIADRDPGDEVEVTFRRGADTGTVRVTLAPR